MLNTSVAAGLLLCFTLANAPFAGAQSSATLYSQNDGSWNAVNLWNTAPDGSGSFVQTPDDPSVSVVVQTGHDITLPVSGYSVYDLTIQAGATLRVGAGSLRYLQVYGNQALIHGAIGGGTDGLGLDFNGPATTLTGSGSVQLSRLRKNCSDAASAEVTDLIVACNVALSWSSSASLLCDGNFTNSTPCSFNLTLNGGYTITAAGDVSIDGINGLSNNTWQEGTFTIHGTLDVADDLFVNTQNPAGADIIYHIGSGGKIVVRSQMLGNGGAGGGAMANLIIENNGVLELRGGGSACSNISASRNAFTFDPGAVVWYNNSAAQTIEPLLPYDVLRAGGGGLKSLAGETTVAGQLWLDGSSIQLNDYNLQLGSATLTGANTSNYLKTNSIGALWRDVGSTSTIFPVGAGSYNPATLENIGAADGFGVRVFDGVFSDGESGYDITAGVVNRSWAIHEATPFDSEIKLTLQWQSSHERPGFNRNACYVSSYESSGWTAGTAGTASGANPYTRARTGLTQFYVFAVGSGTALPVEWLFFNANQEGETVVLKWRTASESNNDYFAVERGSEDVQFQKIGRVPGRGDQTTPQDYEFTDVNPLNGVQYYRLRQTDFDGSYNYSPIVALPFDSVEPLVAYPSPANSLVTLEMPAIPEYDANWQLCDANGAVVLSGTWPAGQSWLELDVGLLLPGVYFFGIWVGRVFVQKVVVVE
ncbi:MAG: hypothetical protein IT270_19810 [Saprospiraceae bacterium]|nr:hypothetical protein [Saprospiraceae bacterium]